MEEAYRTKYPLKKTLYFTLVLSIIYFYIFWGLFHFLVIIGFVILSTYLISITMIPVFVLKNSTLNRVYLFKPFRARYSYEINKLEKVEVRQNRQGYQSFHTMKVFFLQNEKKKNHLLYFIKKDQADFDNLISKMNEKGIKVILVEGN